MSNAPSSPVTIASGAKAGRLLPALAAFAVFAVVFLVHLFSDVRTTADSILTIPRAMSILNEGNTDLDEYRGLPYWGHIKYMFEPKPIHGHVYCMYPIGPSIVALPFVAGVDAWWRRAHGTSYQQYLETRVADGLEEFVASLCVATACLFVYLGARRRTGREWPALLVVFVLAFGTSAWSIASRALWQHGPSMMFLSVALYLLVVAQKRPAAAQFVSLPLAAAYVMRPTNSIPILVLSALVLWKHRRYFLRYALWSLPIAVPFVLFNLNLYGSVLSPYYTPHMLVSPAPFWPAFLGNIISPARGLLVFTPVLVLGLVGAGIKWKEKRLDALDGAFAVIVLAHWVAISKMGWTWWAGHGYGPRFFIDVLPLLVWFLVPVVEKIARPLTPARVALAATFFLLAAVGFVLHYRGANHFAVWLWNVVPNNVDQNTERLWDWKDPQWLRTKKP